MVLNIRYGSILPNPDLVGCQEKATDDEGCHPAVAELGRRISVWPNVAQCGSCDLLTVSDEGNHSGLLIIADADTRGRHRRRRGDRQPGEFAGVSCRLRQLQSGPFS